MKDPLYWPLKQIFFGKRNFSPYKHLHTNEDIKFMSTDIKCSEQEQIHTLQISTRFDLVDE